MNEREQIQNALSPLHASNGTIEEVLKKVEYGKKNTASAVRRIILVVPVIIILLAVTAFAIGKSGLFLKWFGGSENLNDKQEELVSRRVDESKQSVAANGITVTVQEVFAGKSIVKVILRADGKNLAEGDKFDFSLSCQTEQGESVPVHAQSMEHMTYMNQNQYMVTFIAAPDAGCDLLSGDYHLMIHLNTLVATAGDVNGPWVLDVPVPKLEKETCLYLERTKLSSGNVELFDIRITATELQFSALGDPDAEKYSPLAIMSDGTHVTCSFITYSENKLEHTTSYCCYFDQLVDIASLQAIQICGDDVLFMNKKP